MVSLYFEIFISVTGQVAVVSSDGTPTNVAGGQNAFQQPPYEGYPGYQTGFPPGIYPQPGPGIYPSTGNEISVCYSVCMKKLFVMISLIHFMNCISFNPVLFKGIR